MSIPPPTRALLLRFGNSGKIKIDCHGKASPSDSDFARDAVTAKVANPTFQIAAAPASNMLNTFRRRPRYHLTPCILPLSFILVLPTSTNGRCVALPAPESDRVSRRPSLLLLFYAPTALVVLGFPENFARVIRMKREG